LLTLSRDFRSIVVLIARRLAKISESHVVMLWHKIVLHLYEYLLLKPT
jgi:hypothetical protein